MLTVEIKGSELVRVLTNISLWHEKTDLFGEHAWLHLSGGRIYAVATDGYVGVKDHLDIEPVEDLFFWKLATGDVDRLVMAAREVKTKTIEITLADNAINLPYDFDVDEKGKISIKEGTSCVGEGVPSPEDWVNAILDVDLDPEPISHSTWAIRPERWLKLSRVKADKDAPIDVMFVDSWNSKAPSLAVIKIGGSFRAAVNLVDRQKAAQKLGDKADFYLWNQPLETTQISP